MMRALVCSLALLLSAGVASAQTAELSGEFLPAKRQMQGNKLRVCIDRFSAGAALDLAVAEAIGDALFLKVEAKPGLSNFPLTGGGYLTELQFLMHNECDLMMGMVVQSNPAFAEFAAQTRSYAKIPFVFATKDPQVDTLAQADKNLPIGTALGSRAEMTYINWAGQKKAGTTWVRLPYADPALMIRRVRDDTLSGAIIWQPALAKLLADPQPEAGDAAIAIRGVSLTPLPDTVVEVAAIVSAGDDYLRKQMDDAIEALSADGTFAAIMDDLGIEYR